MKNKLKNSAFGALVLLLLTIPFVSVLWESVTIAPGNISAHIVRLYQLTVGWVQMLATQNFLKISQWIVAGNIGSSNESSSQLASIWWWDRNTIDSSSNYAGIGWWINNKVNNWENSLIWWWDGNIIGAKDAVIAWGKWNEVSWEKWVVLWGQSNKVNWNKWIVLWGNGNSAWESSLVMWHGAAWSKNSFSWNANAGDNQARIDAESGILIGTVEPIAGVNLVVNWAVKLSSSDENISGVVGEVRFLNGCFYAYDWLYWHLINQGDSSCNDLDVVNDKTCDFGNVKLQAWDQVKAYKTMLASQNAWWCDYRQVTCSEGKLLTDSGDETYQFPYCYEN